MKPKTVDMAAVRDARASLRKLAGDFPAYAFDRNKGYPSPEHQAALRSDGLCVLHRQSWSFVDRLPRADRPAAPGQTVGPTTAAAGGTIP